MDLKQGEENAKFVKNENSKNRNYIFKWDKQTKIVTVIIITLLIIAISFVVLSGLSFNN